MRIVCLIGIPGSGKGSMGRKLRDDFNYRHLSLGDYTRSLRSEGEFDNNDEALRCLEAGRSLPGWIKLPMLEAQIKKLEDEETEVLVLDGFPRYYEQARYFEALVRNIDTVIHLECPKEVAKYRFLGRNVAGREADDGARFEIRFSRHEEENPAILSHYRALGKLIEIDSSDLSGGVEGTYTNLLKAVAGRALEGTIYW